jgi:hypothetical protein
MNDNEELALLWQRFGLAMQAALKRGWRISLRIERSGSRPVEIPFTSMPTTSHKIVPSSD